MVLVAAGLPDIQPCIDARSLRQKEVIPTAKAELAMFLGQRNALARLDELPPAIRVDIVDAPDPRFFFFGKGRYVGRPKLLSFFR